MDRALYTYALVKSIHEVSGDFLDSLLPFVLIVMHESAQSLPNDGLEEMLQKRFTLSLHIHTIEAIIDRAVAKGYAKKLHRIASITSSGHKYTTGLLNEKDIERRVNNLLQKLSDYITMNKSQEEISIDKLFPILMRFIRRNLSSLTTYLGGHDVMIDDDSAEDYSQQIFDFMIKADKSDPEAYRIICDLIMGSVVCLIAEHCQPESLRGSFAGIRAFLDTNFVFSILDLHFSEISRPCQELFHQLNYEKFDIAVFDFTLQEMRYVLKGYERSYNRYPERIRINSVYSKLRSDRMTPLDVGRIIANLPQKLTNLGIRVEQTGIQLTNDKIEGYDYDGLGRFKEREGTIYPNHDLHAIERILQIRDRHRFERLEDMKAMFLTSDGKLSQYNYRNNGHQSDATICEVILDKLLTNILWFRNPSTASALPIHSVIAAHSTELFIDRVVWAKVYETLARLRSGGEISDIDISLLVHNVMIEKELSEIDENEVTDDLIISIIRNAKIAAETGLRFDWRNEGIVDGEGESASALEPQLDDAATRMKKSKESIIIDLMEPILVKEAKRRASQTNKIIRLSFGVLWISLVATIWYCLRLKIKLWDWIAPVIGGLSLLGVNLVRLGPALEEWFARSYSRRFIDPLRLNNGQGKR